MTHWQRGRVLDTETTRRMSGADLARNVDIEERSIFIGFTAEDEGRSRHLLGRCENVDFAKALVITHNIDVDAFDELLAERDRLRGVIEEQVEHMSNAHTLWWRDWQRGLESAGVLVLTGATLALAWQTDGK